MRIPLFLGLCAGLGVWLVARGFAPSERPLATALQALGRPRDQRSGGNYLDQSVSRLGSIVMSFTGANFGGLSADLLLVERSEEFHLVQRLKTGLLYGLFPVVVWFVTLLGGAPLLPLALVILAGALLGVGGWFLTDAQLKRNAEKQRAEFSTALVAYLQLVSILLAGGAGIGEALTTSVEYGQGRSFRIIRRCLTEARVRGVSPWVAMRESGEHLQLDQLVDLASTMELAGVSGAHVRESLIARARAFRVHEMNAIEREAESRSVAMAGPTAFMVGGFVVLIGYPAFDVILSI